MVQFLERIYGNSGKKVTLELFEGELCVFKYLLGAHRITCINLYLL